MRNNFLAILVLLAASAHPLSACSCGGYVLPMCARDLDAIDSSQTILFVGRVTAAPGGMRDLQEQMREQAKVWTQGPAPHTPPSAAEMQETIESIRKAYLDQYGSRIDEAQREQLLRADSRRALDEIAATFSILGRPVEFEVVENFVGKLPRRIEIFTGRGGGDCGFDFEEGATYLVEAHRRKNGEWHSWLCQSRVMGIEFATEDLRTLRAWKQGKPLGPRIYGTVSDWTKRQDSHRFRYPPVSGVSLSISSGNKVSRVVTDENGHFRLEGLEPSSYSLKLEEPGWSLIRVSDGHQHIDLTTGGCAELSVMIAEQQGTIAGRVLPQPGEELPDYLWIEAIPTDPQKTKPFDATARRGDGKFAIDEMEPGDYFVAINVTNTPSGPHHPGARHGRVWPYGPTYYPGVTDPAMAASFHVERGQTIQLGDWTLPHRLAERRLTGTVTLPSGVPAAGVRIRLRRPGLKEIAEHSGPTSIDGQFVVWPLESLEYALEAESYDPELKVAYRSEIRISAAEQGPLTLQLEKTDETPKDGQFFNAPVWRNP